MEGDRQEVEGVWLSPLTLLPCEAGLPKKGGIEGEDASRRVAASRGEEDKRSSERRGSGAGLLKDLGGVDIAQESQAEGFVWWERRG